MKLRRDTFYPAFEKRLLDDYLRLKGNIRVFIRVRPLLKSDARAYDSGAFAQAEQQLQTPNSQQVELESA